MNNMDFRSSFRAPGEKGFMANKSPQGMFKALRRLHGQNLESRGLNDMTEAFQSFVTRARFFSVGKLRRTWSHSAVEFMKYRRLLPMLLADGQNFESQETDDFDAALAFQATNRDDRKIIVHNISPRITSSQLQSFFSEFGKVSHCSLPREEKKQSVFGTMPKNQRNCGTATITFKRPEDAEKARNATSAQLKFYDQIMTVTSYISKRKGGKGLVLSDESKITPEEERLSRASSTQSLASTTMSISTHEGCSLDDMPTKALELIISYLPVMDTIRMERVSKKFMEASIKSWSHVHRLNMARECEPMRGFGKHKPLRNLHLRAILSRAAGHLKALDLSGTVHLIDDKALQIIARNCPNLVELDLSGVRAQWEALGELTESLTNLHKLSYRDMNNASDKALWYLVKGCGQSLKFIDLRGCKRLHGRCFKLLANHLEQLYLDGCSKLDEMAFEDLCTYSSALKELRINECYKITDENLSMVSRTMTELQALTLCGDKFEKLSTAGLFHITRMQTLVELALDYNPLLSDDLLIAISEGLPLLKSLSIANAGSDQTLTGKGLNSIGRLKNLEQLDLSSLAAVRSGILLEIAFSCRSIELLQLRNCVYLSDDGIVELGRCKSLRHVDLSGSILISSDAVQSFIKGYPQDGKSGPVTMVVGGTAADASKLSVRGSRVVVDFSDYSTIMNIPSSQSTFAIGSQSDDDASDDEFEMLTAQRSFYIDSVCGEDESPIEDEKELLEWAEREAKSLGLITK